MQIRCIAPNPKHIPAIVDLDRRSLGGLWSAQTYLRELESPNSCLRILGQSLNTIEPLDGKPWKDSLDPIATSPGAEEAGAVNRETAEPEAIVGVGCYWEIVDEAHITVLAVDPCYHRRGLGRWLLINLLADACKRTLQRATLEVRASNSRALSLYESFGFEALGTRKHYYPDGEDALILWQNSLNTTNFREKLAFKHSKATQRLNKQGWDIIDPDFFTNRSNS